MLSLLAVVLLSPMLSLALGNITDDDCQSDQFLCRFPGANYSFCLSKQFLCNRKCDCVDCTDEGAQCEETPPCSNVRLPRRPYGVIQSYLFPLAYPRGQSCDWLIDLGRYDRIEIRPETLDLAHGDTLSIYDGPTRSDRLLVQYQSQVGNLRKLHSTTGTVLIWLVSNRANEMPWFHYRGFNLTYQIHGVCIPGQQASCGPTDPGCYDTRWEQCNGAWDCPGSGRDEQDCPRCPPGRFPCAPSEAVTGVACYWAQDRCNGKMDCPTLMDEFNCDPVRCGPHNRTFLCGPPSAQCIPGGWRCDGSSDCPDNSDENGCPPSLGGVSDLRGSTGSVGRMRFTLAATVGSTLCALLVMLAVAYFCRVHLVRVRMARARSLLCTFDSPLQRLVEAELRRRRPPPCYDEAMRTSRPFDAVCREAMFHRLMNHILRAEQQQAPVLSSSRLVTGPGVATPVTDADDVPLLDPSCTAEDQLPEGDAVSDVPLIDPDLPPSIYNYQSDASACGSPPPPYTLA